jgi:hypothetical protein
MADAESSKPMMVERRGSVYVITITFSFTVSLLNQAEIENILQEFCGRRVRSISFTTNKTLRLITLENADVFSFVSKYIGRVQGIMNLSENAEADETT